MTQAGNISPGNRGANHGHTLHNANGGHLNEHKPQDHWLWLGANTSSQRSETDKEERHSLL